MKRLMAALLLSLLAACNSNTGDDTAPVTTMALQLAAVSSSLASVSVAINEDGSGRYLVLPAASAVPSAADILAANSQPLPANTPTQLQVSGLTPDAGFVLYFLALDLAGNVQSEVQSLAFNSMPTVVARFAYVVNSNSNTASIFVLNQVTGAMEAAGSSDVCSGPTAIKVDPAMTFAYIACNDPDQLRSYSIAAGSGQLTATGYSAALSGNVALYLAMHPSNSYAYVVDNMAGAVSTVAINRTTGALSVVGEPLDLSNGILSLQSLAVEPSGHFAYVADSAGDKIHRLSIDPDSGALSLLGTESSWGTRPVATAIDPAGQFLFMTMGSSNQLAMYAINPLDGTLTFKEAQATGGAPEAVSVHPSGRFVYVANLTGGDISSFAIDAEAEALTSLGDNTPTALLPRAMVIDPSGRFLYSANQGTGDGHGFGSVHVIDRQTGALGPVSAVTAGLYPSGIDLVTDLPAP